MAKSFRDTAQWSSYIGSCISNDKVLSSALLFKLLEEMPRYNSNINHLSESNLANYVFSTPSTHSEEDSTLRELSEMGKLLIIKTKSDSEFVTCVPSISLLNWLDISTSRAVYQNRIVAAARHLLLDFKMCQKVGVWWERVVALNIITRSSNHCSMTSLLGIKSIDGDFFSDFNITVARVSSRSPGHSVADCLVIPPASNHPGNDVCLKLIDTASQIAYRFFLQIKLSVPNRASFFAVVASMICHNILETMKDLSIDMNHTHMILYIWNLDDAIFESVNHGRDAVLALVPGTIEKMMSANSTIIPSDFSEIVLHYVKNCYNSHIHVLDNSTMREWLSPSLVAFPMLFTKIETVVI